MQWVFASEFHLMNVKRTMQILGPLLPLPIKDSPLARNYVNLDWIGREARVGTMGSRAALYKSTRIERLPEERRIDASEAFGPPGNRKFGLAYLLYSGQFAFLFVMIGFVFLVISPFSSMFCAALGLIFGYFSYRMGASAGLPAVKISLILIPIALVLWFGRVSLLKFLVP